LPSSHRGGNIIASCGDDELVFNSSTHATYGSLYAAWYADVKYEPTLVASGYRFVLIYDLVQIGPEKSQTAWLAENHSSKLRKALKTWTSNLDSCSEILAYQLGHNPADEVLKIDALDSTDEAKLRCFEKACLQEDITIYLAELERKIKGRVNDDEYRYGTSVIRNPDHDSLQLIRLLTLQGSAVTDNMAFKLGCLIQKDIYAIGREPDDEEIEEPETDDFEEEYDDDEDSGKPVTHRYRDSVRNRLASRCCSGS
jgi:hypothetical protein